jgi:hypothetical protein
MDLPLETSSSQSFERSVTDSRIVLAANFYILENSFSLCSFVPFVFTNLPLPQLDLRNRAN